MYLPLEASFTAIAVSVAIIALIVLHDWLQRLLLAYFPPKPQPGDIPVHIHYYNGQDTIDSPRQVDVHFTDYLYDDGQMHLFIDLSHLEWIATSHSSYYDELAPVPESQMNCKETQPTITSWNHIEN